MRSHLAALAAALVFAMNPAAAGPVVLYAAGSLETALGEVAEDFTERTGIAVDTAFGPSGLMRGRIEDGETAHVFASANMRHPRTLEAAGRGGPVALFARNRLCALAQPEVEVTSATLLEVMLAEGIRLGTSTPKADPSGDYAFELFARAAALRDGATEALEQKSLQLTRGPDSPAPPEGRNTYAWVMEGDRADIFLTYCTNAVLARAETPGLRIVPVPPELSVGADYGLMVLDGAPVEAWRLALHVLSPEGQRVLAAHGFESGALPAKE
jgi:molybdenum ABC transporter molybdate-binding protein